MGEDALVGFEADDSVAYPVYDPVGLDAERERRLRPHISVPLADELVPVAKIAFVLASIGFSQTEKLVEFGGLFQRITLTVGWAWLTLLAVYLLRTDRQSSTSRVQRRQESESSSANSAPTSLPGASVGAL